TSSGWPERHPQFLAAVEKHLAAFLGPIANVVTRRTAAQAKDPAELFGLLAATLHSESDRKAFLARKDEFLRRFPRAQQVASVSATEKSVENSGATLAQVVSSVSGRAELTPAAIRRASDRLARHVGPVARVLAERATQRADSLRGLYLMLAEHVHDPAER